MRAKLDAGRARGTLLRMQARFFTLVWLTAACAGSSASRPPPKAVPPAPEMHAQAPAPAAPSPAEVAVATSAPANADARDAVLPDALDAGAIARGTLSGVLAGGIGRFLQRVRTEPDFDEKGRFAGWRIVSFAEGDASLRSSILRPGDTVWRVNGQSIERPEQFKDVWDSLATSSELVLQVRRHGKPSELRYRIID